MGGVGAPIQGEGCLAGGRLVPSARGRLSLGGRHGQGHGTGGGERGKGWGVRYQQGADQDQVCASGWKVKQRGCRAGAWPGQWGGWGPESLARKLGGEV